MASKKTKKASRPRRPVERRFVGVSCRKMKPTLEHRPALWECMLGTLYALNDKGQCKYFDYDWDAAIAFAGVDRDNKTGDNRVFKVTRDRHCNYTDDSANPRLGKLVLWVRE